MQELEAKVEYLLKRIEELENELNDRLTPIENRFKTFDKAVKDNPPPTKLEQ